MRKLAVVHHRHAEWVPAISGAESRILVRGWHPKDDQDVSTDPWLADAEGLFVWRVPAGLIERMPALKWIQCAGAGVDHLLADRSIPPGIAITRADGQFGLWMSRYVAAHLLTESQRLEECRQAQDERTWRPQLLPEELTGRIALIHGFGRIGRSIGQALRALGMEVHGFVRSPRDDAEFPLHGPEALRELLPSARVLVLSAPLTVDTRGLVDAGLLANGHGGLTLVNVARGEQIVESDLLLALEKGTLGRAVLDVFPVEPLPADSPLWNHPRVVVTPHHSGPSRPRAMIPDILPNLRRFAEGLPAEGVVDRARGY
jgi:glyoxylate/hydroxypyruvate reductase A